MLCIEKYNYTDRHGGFNKNRCIIIRLSIPKRPMKERRQHAILELVDHEPLHSQEQLRRRLRHRGFDATQATISRDIKELGLMKRAGDGAYQRSGAEIADPETSLAALEHAAAEYLRRIDCVQQL